MASLSFTVMTPKLYARETPRPAAYTTTNTTTTVRFPAAKRRVVVRATPEKLSESIEQSVKAAQEACADDPVSGECKAAWDEVEEVSAAASHARDKNKATDVLDVYCKDNPETDECRIHDN